MDLLTRLYASMLHELVPSCERSDSFEWVRYWRQHYTIKRQKEPNKAMTERKTQSALPAVHHFVAFLDVTSSSLSSAIRIHSESYANYYWSIVQDNIPSQHPCGGLKYLQSVILHEFMQEFSFNQGIRSSINVVRVPASMSHCGCIVFACPPSWEAIRKRSCSPWYVPKSMRHLYRLNFVRWI